MRSGTSRSRLKGSSRAFPSARAPYVLHGVAEAEHIFGELYRVPEKIRIPYFKVKILELLLYLDAMTIPQVESDIFLMLMLSPSSQVTSSRKRITLSKLSSGSPMPMRTIWEIRIFSSR